MKRLICLLIALTLCAGCALGEDSADTAALTEQMLENACLNAGNNTRLKSALDRAKAGENITVAIIGGSITEGAGASNYSECYASRVGVRLNGTYGIGANISLINAGVGGTPSTFGWMRYEQDVLKRVPEKDADGLPDIVIIEFAVNDWNEPTYHRCYESMVKSILEAENEPAVILLFSVFKTGWNLQDELKKIGETYDLTMISIRDAAYPMIGKLWSADEWFFDEYHPTSLGHKIMSDCIMSVINKAYEQETPDSDINLDVAPAYGLDYMDIRRIFAGRELPSGVELNAGGFSADDKTSYANYPVGRVCGQNFSHNSATGDEPLSFTAEFSKLLIGWRNAVGFGSADVYVDGKLVTRLIPTAGGWGQTEVNLICDYAESEIHTVEIKMSEGQESKQFTITCMAISGALQSAK